MRRAFISGAEKTVCNCLDESEKQQGVFFVFAIEFGILVEARASADAGRVLKGERQ